MNEKWILNNFEIAVIMAVYAKDTPEHFREALQSVLDQTTSRIGTIKIYLAVDGPICQELEKVISEHRDDIYVAIRLGVNSGLSAALNTLINRLENEPYVFRMDADDVSLPDRFEKQICFMEENPEVDILGGAILEFGESYESEILVTYPSTDDDARRQIAYRSPLAHPTVCFRRRVFDVAECYPDIEANEDIAFWFKCLQLGLKFANLQTPVLKFRVGSGFWQRRGFRKSLLELKCYHKGLIAIEGPSIRLSVPLLRFFFRMMPTFALKTGYRLRGKSAE